MRLAGPYCLIGGLAVNCYVEPVYTLDADLVAVAAILPELYQGLQRFGFEIEAHAHSINAVTQESRLRIQFTMDERYQTFPSRAIQSEVLGVLTRVACLEDVVQGKLWAYCDPGQRLSKRKKDELDLIRLGETHPELISKYPAGLRDLIAGGT